MGATTRSDANASAVPGSRPTSGNESTSTPMRTLLTAPENTSSRERGASRTRSPCTATIARPAKRLPIRLENAKAGATVRIDPDFTAPQHGERRERQEREMGAGDEQAAEEQQRRELRAEDRQPRQRLRHQDAEVGLIRKERVAHQAAGAGDDPHRHGHEECVIGHDRELVGVWRSSRERCRTSP